MPFTQLMHPIDSLSEHNYIYFYSLECQIQADIAPQNVQWLLNGQELIQSDRVETSYLEDTGIAHLTVHEVRPTDSGEYACKVVGEMVEPKTGGERVTKTITSATSVSISGKHSVRRNILFNVISNKYKQMCLCLFSPKGEKWDNVKNATFHLYKYIMQ